MELYDLAGYLSGDHGGGVAEGEEEGSGGGGGGCSGSQSSAVHLLSLVCRNKW
jgi:hypothetical protein